MLKHINFFGYSLWIQDQEEGLSEELPLIKPIYLYSPIVLATYCICASSFIGVFLYGINISRRGYYWRGRLLIAFSGAIFTFYIVGQSSILLLALDNLLGLLGMWPNTLVGISLYASEKPHFNRMIRKGGKPAKWWLPLICITAIAAAPFLLRFLL